MKRQKRFSFTEVFVDVDPGPGESPLEALKAGRLALSDSEQTRMTFADTLERALEKLGLIELVIKGGRDLDPRCFIETSVTEFLDGFESDTFLPAWCLVEQEVG